MMSKYLNYVNLVFYSLVHYLKCLFKIYFYPFFYFCFEYYGPHWCDGYFEQETKEIQTPERYLLEASFTRSKAATLEKWELPQ